MAAPKEVEIVLKDLQLKNWENYLVGTYKSDKDSIEEAQMNSMLRMERLVPKIKKSSKVLILSKGNAFVPIYLASKYNCKITVMVENEALKDRIEEEVHAYEQDDYVTVIVKDFQQTQVDYDYFDMAWSLGALNKRPYLLRALREIRRILVPQGRFILCEEVATEEDIHMGDEVIHSLEEFLKLANRADLEKVYLKDFQKESVDHYNRLMEEVNDKKSLATEQSKIKELQDLTANKDFCWRFIQLQKRNA